MEKWRALHVRGDLVPRSSRSETAEVVGHPSLWRGAREHSSAGCFGLHKAGGARVALRWPCRSGPVALAIGPVVQAPYDPCHTGKNLMTTVGDALLRGFPFKSTPDKQIRSWKARWLRGAEAGWAGASPAANPFRAGSSPHSAWTAGWNWARNNPDRRRQIVSGLAHPYRRITDTMPRLIRGATASAVGLSALTIIGGLWAIRRRRGRSG